MTKSDTKQRPTNRRSAPKSEAPVGRPNKIPAERPAAIAQRERFHDWREERRNRR